MNRISVVIATYNRLGLLKELLRGLAEQTLPAQDYEVIVVDDGSKEPVRPALLAMSLPFELTVIEQKNAGAATARHNGILRARGEIIVLLDDDMLVVPEFLKEHLAAHERGATVVVGHIADDEELGVHKPLFELFQSRTLSRFMHAVRDGRITLRGMNLCSGNASFRRDAYLATSGFDKSLPHAEDRELGIRLEKAGGRVVFADGAKSIHRSDRADLDAWLRRSFLYGVCDTQIARKHPDVPVADPWRYLSIVSPISVPLLITATAAPKVGRALSRAAMRTAMEAEKLGAERAALAGVTLAFGLQYFQGVRAEAGSLSRAAADLFAYLKKIR